jgi:hypothetical protein
LAEAKIPRIGSPQSFLDSPDSSQGHPRMASTQYAFHVIKKYKVGYWASSTHCYLLCLHVRHEICGKTLGSSNHTNHATKEPVDVFFTDWDLYSEMLV